MAKGKTLIGRVLGQKTPKTVVVLVETIYRHPKYGKILRKRKKYLVHSEEKIAEGKEVIIRETRPISKRKHFEVEKVL